MQMSSMLFLCHGKLHPRHHVTFLPFLNQANSKGVWEEATYVDIDTFTLPDVVADVSKSAKRRFRARSFDMIISMFCPNSMYVSTPTKLNRSFWTNIAAWLVPGGVFISLAPLRLIKSFSRWTIPENVRGPVNKNLEEVDNFKEFGATLAGREKSCLAKIKLPIARRLFKAYSNRDGDYERLAETAGQKDICYRNFTNWLEMNVSRGKKPASLMDVPLNLCLSADEKKNFQLLKREVEICTNNKLQALSQAQSEKCFGIRGHAFCFQRVTRVGERSPITVHFRR